MPPNTKTTYKAVIELSDEDPDKVAAVEYFALHEIGAKPKKLTEKDIEELQKVVRLRRPVENSKKNGRPDTVGIVYDEETDQYRAKILPYCEYEDMDPALIWDSLSPEMQAVLLPQKEEMKQKPLRGRAGVEARAARAKQTKKELEVKPAEAGLVEARPGLAAATLPRWPEAVRGVPSAFLRSALFSVIGKGRRDLVDDWEVVQSAGIRMLYSGPRLDQLDLDVYLHTLHLARTQGLGVPIDVRPSIFLSGLERANTGKNISSLSDSLRRLTKAHLTLMSDGGEIWFAGTLLMPSAWNGVTGRAAFSVQPSVAALFKSGEWSSIELQQRRALASSGPIAQWLHAWIGSHTKVHPYKVETLMGLCGANYSQLRGWRRALKDAAGRVSEVTCWKILIDENDCLQAHKN